VESPRPGLPDEGLSALRNGADPGSKGARRDSRQSTSSSSGTSTAHATEGPERVDATRPGVGETSPAPSVQSPLPRPSGGVADATTRGIDANTRSVRSSSPRSHSSARPSLPADTPDEMELLKRARAALAGNPGSALQYAEQHKQHYASGALNEERELIAITALVRLGRQSAAARRAERFRQRYPRSLYNKQITNLLGEAE
jgi:hypothetical protein